MKPLEAQTLRALLSKSNWDSLGDVVDVQTFKSMASRKLYTVMGQLHDETDSDITTAMVESHIDAVYQLKLDIRDELLDQMRYVVACPPQDANTLRYTISQMIRRAKSLEAADYVSIHIDTPEFDPNVPLQLFQRASELTMALDAEVMDYRTAPPPSHDDRKGIVSIGLHPEIDVALGGGAGLGEVLVVLAPSGHGKTSHLCWMGAESLREGENVLHISCEDHGYKVRGRYDSCFTQFDKDDLLKYPNKVMEKRAQVPGNLYIQDWSDREVRASDVKSLIMRMRKNGRPVTTVIVDYLGKMSADAKMWDGARPFGKVTCELRRVANAEQFRCITGWQTNKGGWRAQLLSVDDVADDVGVYRECDAMVGININPQQLKEKRAIHNVIKSRGGTARPAKIHHIDMDRMNFFVAANQPKGKEDVGDAGTT
jgi:hypothetical protein